MATFCGTSRSGTRIFLVPLMLAALALLLVPARHANAHPLGNFTLNRYARIETYRDLLRVTYVLDLAEIPSFQELGAIDANNDGASPDELEAWAHRISSERVAGLLLTLDGHPLALTIASTSASSTLGQSNLPMLRLETTYEATVPE